MTTMMMMLMRVILCSTVIKNVGIPDDQVYLVEYYSRRKDGKGPLQTSLVVSTPICFPNEESLLPAAALGHQ